ncbi:hypothetical protein D9V86_01915 [Bacteroidetes/Chlorobi group bacterium ChocPot_Mid]|nr:MAG: hypothetical protein D9V86_01915 [Bacteroidetes/Chlorobi group bacterium ChocPot_Mid]
MNPILKNILAVIVGVVVGSIVNMGLVMLGPMIIPMPAGVDVTSSESLAKSLHLFGFQHFIFPFLAHAVGTFVGAMLTAWIAVNRKMLFAMIIGLFFLIGGITNIFMLPSPVAFTIIDLVFAYIPMAWFAGKIMTRK